MQIPELLIPVLLGGLGTLRKMDPPIGGPPLYKTQAASLPLSFDMITRLPGFFASVSLETK